MEPHSTSPPEHGPGQPAPGPRGPAGRRTWSQRLTIWVAIALVLAPLVAALYDREVSQWWLAAAEVQYAEGNIDTAMQQLEQAIAWNSEDARLWLTSARWKYKQGKIDESRAEANQAVELANSTVLRNELISLLQLLGQHEQAIEISRQLVEQSKEKPELVRALRLNALAYSRAVAGKDLEQALQEINRAIKFIEANSRQAANAGPLDTRGFILWQLGRFDEALQDLTPAVVAVEVEYKHLPKHLDDIPDPIFAEEIAENYRKNVAVIRYHRGLVHRDLGHKKEAKEDFARVRELGFEPDEQLF